MPSPLILIDAGSSQKAKIYPEGAIAWQQALP